MEHHTMQKQKLLRRSTMEVQSFFSVSLFLILAYKLNPIAAQSCRPIVATDGDRIQFALNLEFLEAEFFLNGALGKGLDDIAPNLALGGPPPIGARKANLNPPVLQIIEEFGYQEVGHLRSIITTVGGFPRPQLNLSKEVFGNMIDNAVGYKLIPSFDPYANTINYLLTAYMIPYLGLVGYVGAIPRLVFPQYRMLVASLLGVESGQDAVIRTLLYGVANDIVFPYNFTVANLTNLISSLVNRRAACGVKDEGLMEPLFLGAENRTNSNILSADVNSLSYSRTPQEILRTVYGTGNERIPGGILPRGGGGNIARRFIVLGF